MSITHVKTKYEVIKETRYLRFTKIERPPDKKTDTIIIENKSGNYILGRIKWFGRWRQYCFFAENETIWNSGCMEDVYDVLKDLKKQKNENR